MMFEFRDQDFVARRQARSRITLCDEVDAVGGAARVDDLGPRPGIDEVHETITRAFVLARGTL